MNNTHQPFFTSDFHFFHRNIMKFCPFSRKGNSLEEMHELIIQNVIDTVPKHGDLWNLGDISFGKYDETRKLLRRISDHCNHHLILGNHDNESDLRSMGVFATVQSIDCR
jgi:calcineurin-like phosphoesterase family protein